MFIFIQYDNVVNGKEVDTNDVDIEVKNDLKVVKDGLQIEEIDITIEDAGNCKYVYVTFASNRKH